MKRLLLLTGMTLTFGLGSVAYGQDVRLPDLTREQMSSAQQQAADATVSGKRKTLEGPFNIWLRSPPLENRLQQVGQYVRFQTSLPHQLNEFAILITAKEWASPFEWSYHYPLAVKEGMEPAVLEQLRVGTAIKGMTDDEQMVYDFSVQLHRNHQVSDAVYNRVFKRFGERGVVDLIAVDGYYTTVAMTLNVGHVPPTPGGVPAFPEAPLPQ